MPISSGKQVARQIMVQPVTFPTMGKRARFTATAGACSHTVHVSQWAWDVDGRGWGGVTPHVSISFNSFFPEYLLRNRRQYMPVTVLRSLSLVVCEVPQETWEDYKKTDKLTGCATCSRLIRKHGIELGLSVPVSLNRTWIITDSLWYPAAFSPQRNKALPRGQSKTKGWLNDATLLLIHTLWTSNSSQLGNTSSLSVWASRRLSLHISDWMLHMHENKYFAGV